MVGKSRRSTENLSFAQLGSCASPKNDCFILPNLDLSLRYVSIPKIIHQIYLQGEANIPDNIKKSVAELRRNPDWDYRLYDENVNFGLYPTPL